MEFYKNIYKELIEEARAYNLIIIEKEFRSNARGLCKGNKIAINRNINSIKEKAEILAEEIAHCLFTCGDIIDLSAPGNKEREIFARDISRIRLNGIKYSQIIEELKRYGEQNEIK